MLLTFLASSFESWYKVFFCTRIIKVIMIKAFF